MNNLNIFQEAIVTVWFLTKLSLGALVFIGARVVWRKVRAIANEFGEDEFGQDETEDWLERYS